MDWSDVLRRIGEGESSETEFKSRLTGHGKTICAFANGKGGLLVLGVEDDGTIAGISEDPEKIQERLTSFLQNGCGAPLVADVGRHRHGRRWVHWVAVAAQGRRGGPFQLDGRYWIRRGRATVAPSLSELQELFNRFAVVITEEQVIAGTTIDDIDIGAFRDFKRQQGSDMDREPQVPLENDLRNSSVLGPSDVVSGVTLFGILVFGRNPQVHRRMGNLVIECAAYAGADRASDVLLVGRAAGRLDEQVDRAMGWFRSLGHKELYEDVVREDVPMVPWKVLREALVNAVIHRDYAITGSKVVLEVFADRVVVTSPGTLPNHMDVENVRRGGNPRSRNEMTANAMSTKGYMEARGRGWLMMRREMREFNATEPELTNDTINRFVSVIFRLLPP